MRPIQYQRNFICHFHIEFNFFLLKNATSVSGSCLQKSKILRENELTLPHKSSCTTAANSGEIREKHTPIVKSRWVIFNPVLPPKAASYLERTGHIF